jgi:hypothetical protein
MLLVSSTTLMIRAVLRVAFNLLIAQLLLLDLRQSKRPHALVVRFASLIVVKHDVVSRAVPMTASAADEDISIGYVVKLAVRAVWRNAMAEAWVVAEELLKFETVISSEYVRSSVLLHRVVVDVALQCSDAHGHLISFNFTVAPTLLSSQFAKQSRHTAGKLGQPPRCGKSSV